jgi:hypothetical protein
LKGRLGRKWQNGINPASGEPPGMRGFYAMAGPNVNANTGSQIVIPDDARCASIRNPELI